MTSPTPPTPRPLCARCGSFSPQGRICPVCVIEMREAVDTRRAARDAATYLQGLRTGLVLAMRMGFVEAQRACVLSAFELARLAERMGIAYAPLAALRAQFPTRAPAPASDPMPDTISASPASQTTLVDRPFMATPIPVHGPRWSMPSDAVARQWAAGQQVTLRYARARVATCARAVWN